MSGVSAEDFDDTVALAVVVTAVLTEWLFERGVPAGAVRAGVITNGDAVPICSVNRDQCADLRTHVPRQVMWMGCTALGRASTTVTW